jgi:hypothetical protein
MLYLTGLLQDIIANLYGAHRMTGLQTVQCSLTRKGSLYKYGALLASYGPLWGHYD